VNRDVETGLIFFSGVFVGAMLMGAIWWASATARGEQEACAAALDHRSAADSIAILRDAPLCIRDALGGTP
jgi:hypothetical protein